MSKLKITIQSAISSEQVQQRALENADLLLRELYGNRYPDNKTTFLKKYGIAVLDKDETIIGLNTGTWLDVKNRAEGTCLVTLWMHKRRCDDFQALSEIADFLGIQPQRYSFLG